VTGWDGGRDAPDPNCGGTVIMKDLKKNEEMKRRKGEEEAVVIEWGVRLVFLLDEE